MIGSIRTTEPSLAYVLASPEGRDAIAAVLREWVGERRWFPRRPVGLGELSVDAWVPIPPDGDLVLAVARARYNDGHETTLLLPLLGILAGGDLGLSDAADHAEALKRIAAVLTSGTTTEGEGATLRSVLNDPGQDCSGPAKALGVEQSNTSFLLGDACIAKLFRVFQVGSNPDAELVAFLSDQDFAGVPRSIAVARLATVAGEGDLASVQSFVPNEGDGWSWALERANEAFEKSGDDIVSWLREERATLEGASQLGSITGQLHCAFAAAMAPGLAPRSLRPADVEELAQAIVAEAQATADLLETRDPVATASLRELSEDALIGRIGPPVGLLTRIHGDYHLGQVLRTDDGWVIVDFEGEPARPLAERVALQHPLTDVAGMLRSWDYAATTAGVVHPQRDAWRDAVSSAFLDSYWAEVSGDPVAFVPRDENLRVEILRLLSLRKALYEVRYELASRPTWVDIPLAAVKAMLMELA